MCIRDRYSGWGVSLTRPVLESVWSYIGWGVYLTRPVLASVSSFGESLLHAACWFRLVVRRMGSLYYMPRAGICLVHSAVICLVVHREWRLYYTARDGICLVLGRWGVSLTRPVLQFVLSFVGKGVSYTPRAAKCFVVRR